MSTATLVKIAQVLKEADRILLFPHIHMDGDALGSCAALCSALRQMGKQAYVLTEERVPDYLAFLDDGFVTAGSPFAKPDLCMAVDCGDKTRFPGREEVFFSAGVTACVDHHITAGAFTDYHYVDSKSAATGELIYQLLLLMEAEITPFMADALFAAIATDTGNFRYSNTTAKTHEITAALYSCGMNHAEVCSKLYENMRLEQLRLHSVVLSGMEVFGGGQAVIACVSRKLLADTGAAMDETEGIVEQLRSIAGVEVAVLLKEISETDIKAGFRSKNAFDVAALAQSFGGGGHVKASGCSLSVELAEAKTLVKAAVERLLAGGES